MLPIMDNCRSGSRLAGRWAAFNIVGAVGVIVQVAAFAYPGPGVPLALPVGHGRGG